MSDLKPGDVIEVHFLKLEGIVARDVWEGAVILSMDATSLNVRPLLSARAPKVSAFANGAELMAVEISQRHHTWR